MSAICHVYHGDNKLYLDDDDDDDDDADDDDDVHFASYQYA
jgi:hypothetical protein